MSTQGRARVLGRVMTYNGTTAWLRQLGGNGRDIIACEEDLPGTIRAGARVTYAIAQDPDNQKRSRAVDIKLRDRQPLNEITRIWESGQGP